MHDKEMKKDVLKSQKHECMYNDSLFLSRTHFFFFGGTLFCFLSEADKYHHLAAMGKQQGLLTSSGLRIWK
jgi:hypothetical protein